MEDLIIRIDLDHSFVRLAKEAGASFTLRKTAVDISFIDVQIQKYLYEYIHDNGMVKNYQITALRKYLQNEETISQL